MNRLHRICRAVGALATLAGVLLVAALTASPAHAMPLPPPDPGAAGVVAPPSTTYTVVTGGMPGWQVTLIAVGAALAAAVLAVLADRAWAARRRAAHAAI